MLNKYFRKNNYISLLNKNNFNNMNCKNKLFCHENTPKTNIVTTPTTTPGAAKITICRNVDNMKKEKTDITKLTYCHLQEKDLQMKKQ